MKWRAYRPALAGSLKEPLERDDQLQAVAAEWFEAVVPVERRGPFILGVDDQGEEGSLRTRCANGCVSQQGASEFWPWNTWSMVLALRLSSSSRAIRPASIVLPRPVCRRR